MNSTMDAANNKRSFSNWIFNPFVYIAGWQSLVIGVVVILATGYIGSLGNAHFDGVLDTHTGISAPLWIIMSEGLIDWLSLSLVLFVFGKIISKTSFRLLDLLGTQALARWPVIISACVFLPKAVGRFALSIADKSNPSGFTLNSSDAVIFAVAVLVAILITCWFVILMFRSYAISCNVKGGKAIGTFVAGLLIAEVISKFLIVLLVGVGCVGGGKLFKIPTTSMEPTIKHGSRVVADTKYYTHNQIQRFDIVIVKAADGKYHVKRVIGLGGETVRLQGGKVVVNGQEIKESFASTPTTNEFGPLAVPARQYFLLGDNRPNSFDSRHWTPPTVGSDMILGKLVEDHAK